MTKYLPPNLLALFAPRRPLEYKPPPDKLMIDRRKPKISGMAQYVGLFEDPKDAPPKVYIETREDIRKRKIEEKKELMAYKLEKEIASWKPEKNPKATRDPYKTIFVGRLSYDTDESKLKHVFGWYGKIKQIVLVRDLKGKSRGYAFIEYERTSSMSDAYKDADGIKIDGRRVVVDYERGRTVKNWLPRRLGGGKGGSSRR